MSLDCDFDDPTFGLGYFCLTIDAIEGLLVGFRLYLEERLICVFYRFAKLLVPFGF